MNLLRLIASRKANLIPWTPAQISTSVWLDAADATTVTLNSSKVSQWNDKSGNNNNYSEATLSKMPTYLTASKNGLNTMGFEASNSQRLVNTTFSYTGNTMHCFMVVKETVASSYSTYARYLTFTNSANSNDFANTNSLIFTNNGSNYFDLFRLSSTVARQSMVESTWYMFDGQRNGIDGKLAKNGGTYATGTTNSANQNINVSTVGSTYLTEYSYGGSLSGEIAEVVVLTYIPSSNVVYKLQGYLAWKWGMQGSLPIDHPYKSAPPYV